MSWRRPCRWAALGRGGVLFVGGAAGVMCGEGRVGGGARVWGVGGVEGGLFDARCRGQGGREEWPTAGVACVGGLQAETLIPKP